MLNPILSSMKWYLVKMEHAIEQILNVPPPANSKLLRLNYGLYIESIFSLVDYLKDSNINIIPDLQVSLEKQGDNTYYYFRELRNSIIHRGFDLSPQGRIIDNKVLLTTPYQVTNKNDKLCDTPKEKILLKALLYFDLALRKVIASRVRIMGLLDKKDIDEEETKQKTINGFLLSDAPDYVKTFF